MDISALEEKRISISRRLDDISIPALKTATQTTEQLQTATSVSKKKKRGRRSVTPIHLPDDVPSEALDTVTTTTHPAKVMRCDRSDTHWDFLLKEMKWLAADFQVERKRHLGFSKKMSVSAAVYCEGAVAREVKSIQDATMKQRKLAARVARECTKKFWSQIHRVITYKQKVSYDTMRHNAMNQQLVQLVQQTEKYTAFLSMAHPTGEENNSSSKRQDLSIEQALTNTVERRSKNRIRDYAQLLHHVETTDGETSYYGESTDDNSGSDATYVNEEDDMSTDDESTLRAAEMEEWRERHSNLVVINQNEAVDEDAVVFEADPVELQLLQEEADMDIQQVLERLKADTTTCDEVMSTTTKQNVQRFDNEVKGVGEVVSSAIPSVKQANSTDKSEPIILPVTRSVDGSDADDDMDASDVDDYDDNKNDDEEDDDDFVVEIEEVDDETTMELEELLPRDIPPEDEIRLLQHENEMSVEELRKLYSGALLGTQLNDSVDQTDVNMEQQLPTSEQDGMDLENTDIEVDVKATSALQLLLSPKKEIENMDDNNEEEEDFVPEEAVDDETTIDIEEEMCRDMSFAQELSILKRESEMSVDELRALYSQIDDDSGSSSSKDKMETTRDLLDSVDDQENDEEFVPDEDMPDDESTLDAEVRLGPETNSNDEIALLKLESELPIEDLRRMYNYSSAVGYDSDATPRNSTGSDEKYKGTSGNGTNQGPTTAIVSRPFLIPPRVKLREYQHLGLSWLVSLQTRRLNGILADGMIRLFIYFSFEVVNFDC